MYQLKINPKIQNQNKILKWFLTTFFIHRIVKIIINKYAPIAYQENGIQKNHAKSKLKTEEQESWVFISQTKEFVSWFFIKYAHFVK